METTTGSRSQSSPASKLPARNAGEARPLGARRGSLRNRILAWSFIPTALIFLAVAAATFYAYQRLTEDLVMERNQELARLTAGQLEAELVDYADLLRAAASTPDVYEFDPALQQAALRQEIHRLIVFDAGVVILDDRGEVVAAGPRVSQTVGQDWAGRTYFQRMLRSPDVVVSDIVPEGSEGEDVIVLGVPITTVEDGFRGMIAGMFRLDDVRISDFYRRIFLKLRLREDVVSYIVDGNGRVIYHTQTQRIGEDLASAPAVQRALEGRTGAIRTLSEQGEEIVASFAPIQGTRWGLVTYESWADLVASSEGYRRLLIALMALGIAAPAVLITVGVGRITRPIGELARAAGEVAGGRFDQRIDVDTGDEVEELAERFNLMSDRLQESYATLERKVADRTRELAALNAIAEVVSRSLDLEEIMRSALDKTLEVMSMEAGAAYRLDGDTLVLMAQRGFSEGFASGVARLSLRLSVASSAAKRGAPAIRRVAEYPHGALKGLLEAEGLRLVVSVPLLAKGEMLGVLNLASRSLRGLTPEEMELLAAVGQQTGVAVENARLYERAEHSAIAAERSRLARDLHDAVSQTLFSASMIAEVLPRIWERNQEEGRRRLDELRQLTRGALAEMRTLLFELRPAALADADLSELLRQLAESVTGRARVPVALRVEGEGALPAEVKVAFYRIAQEALNNVAKHSGAASATVGLRYRPEGAELAVVDDGKGFDPACISPEHLGLGIMRERGQAVGAELSIESGAGRGTRVEATWLCARIKAKEA